MILEGSRIQFTENEKRSQLIYNTNLEKIILLTENTNIFTRVQMTKKCGKSLISTFAVCRKYGQYGLLSKREVKMAG